MTTTPVPKPDQAAPTSQVFKPIIIKHEDGTEEYVLMPAESEEEKKSSWKERLTIAYVVVGIVALLTTAALNYYSLKKAKS